MKTIKKAFTLITLLILVTSVYAQSPEYWGMTSAGGAYDAGVIFKTDSIGLNYAIEHSLSKSEGSHPQFSTLCEHPNGKMYGMARAGGLYDDGVLFEYDTLTQKTTKKIDFQWAVNGGYPSGGLMLASNGKLYGVTNFGGSFGNGTMFEYDPISNVLVTKITFNGSVKGASPIDGLCQASNGKLYGLTSSGGTFNQGVFYEYNITTSTFLKITNLSTTTGYSPKGVVIQASNGKIYGLTSVGASVFGGCGSLFEYNLTSGVFVKKIIFGTGNLICTPIGSLIEASNGKLYGLSSGGGANSEGTLFEYVIATNTVSVKVDFDNLLKGDSPLGSLVQAANGKLYGTTKEGGSNDDGVIFEFNPTTNSFQVKHAFNSAGPYGPTGGALIQASNGKLYGAYLWGGETSQGVLFQYNLTTNSYSEPIKFNVGINGSLPMGALIQSSNGNLYGLTNDGGTNGDGTLFEYNQVTHTYTKKVDFLGNSLGGSKPKGSLLEASNGKLYGLWEKGGAYQYGGIFEYDALTNVVTRKVEFDGALKGSNPTGSMIQAGNGKLYGLTKYGGSALSAGALFEYDPSTNIYTKKVAMDALVTGRRPFGSLVLASNGKMYGLTQNGGVSNFGVLFEYDYLTNSYIKLVEFDTISGGRPEGSLIQASNGHLYGLTTIGGINGDGVLFEYNISTNTYTKKVEFEESTKGSNPVGDLLQSSNGILYGYTKKGGSNGSGVLFEYDINTSTYTKKLDYNSTNGRIPVSHLIEIVGCNSTFHTYSTIVCDSFIVPSGDTTYTNPGSYSVMDTVLNICGGDSILTINLTILNSSFSTDTLSACDSLTWIDGITYFSSDSMATVTLVNSIGCDSIVYLNLTIQYSSSSIDSYTVCDSLTWMDGITYFSSNNSATYTVVNSVGCDSIITLDLTVSNLNSSFAYIDLGTANYSFTNSSTGSFTNSHWAFGDGTTSTTLNSFHHYTANGTYIVVLSIYDSNIVGDSCVSYYMDTINVTGVNNPTQCNAGWVVFADSSSGGVTIVNSSTGTGLSYHWDFGDGDTSNLTYPSHTYTSSGPFNLCLTVNDGNGCSDTYCDSISSNGVLFKNGFDLNVVASYPLGIQKLTSAPEIKIYPNPTSSQLNIEVQNFEITKIQIRDNSGKAVKTIISNFDVVNVESLATGVYHLELFGESEVITKKFIKQ